MRKNKIKYTRLLMALATTVTMLVATSCSNAETRPDKDMVLKINGSSSLMANGGVGTPWSNISFTTSLIFRNLFIADSTSEEVKSDLAESYTISEDGLVYEIVLKENQLWSDGEKIDLEDVVFSIESIFEFTKANAIFTGSFINIVGAEEFTNGQADSIKGLEVDGNKLTITLTKPIATFTRILAQFAILPEHILGDIPPSEQADNEYWLNPVVSGMYKMGEHVVGESLEYVFNEKYNGDKPYINSLLLRNDYTPEEYDYFDTTDIAEIQEYRGVSNKTEYNINTLFYRYLVFNVQKGDEIDPVMGDVRVRNAIVNAIDKETLLSDIYFNTMANIDTNDWRIENNIPLDVDFSYNPERAKELLAEAEYDFDRPLYVMYYYNDDTSIKFMEAVKYYLEEVGFNVELIPKGNLYSDEFDHYDVALKGLSAFDVSEWYKEFHSTNPMHLNVFGGEPLFDELIDELDATQTPEEKTEVLTRLRILGDDVLYKYPLYTMRHMAYINKYRVELPTDAELANPKYRYDISFEDWKIIN